MMLALNCLLHSTVSQTDVQAVGHDCDLALLSVEDEAFWSTPTDMLPLELGPLPSLQTVRNTYR